MSLDQKVNMSMIIDILAFLHVSKLFKAVRGDRRMIYVYAINMGEDSWEKNLDSLVSVLSEERKEKTRKYRYKVDQNRSILGEALLKYMLWKHYGLFWQDIHFRYETYGKPSLIGTDGIYFNISHAGNWVLCALGNVPIGVDVEEKTSDFMSIAKRFFAKEEYEYILCQTSENRADIFCKIWTLKESYVKCTGEGLNISLDSFSFQFSAQKIQMYRNNGLCKEYLFQSWKPDDSCYMALCVQDKDDGICCTKMNVIAIDELLQWALML